MPHPSSRALGLGQILLVVAVFLWGAFLSFWNLLATNVHVDERVYVDAGRAYVGGDFSANREHPPLAKYVYGLAQLIFGDGVLGPRIVVGLLVMGSGLIIWLWLGREIGRMRALIPVLVWFCIPRGFGSEVLRIDRIAFLEPVMVFFALVALASAWRWYRGGSTLWIVLSGVALGASVASKVSAAMFGVALIVLLFGSGRRVAIVIRDALIFLATLVITFTLAYLPMGMVDAISGMLENQAAHNKFGHLVSIAGTVYTHAPWWSQLWLTKQGLGTLGTVVLVIGMVLAVVLARPRTLVLYLGVALAAFAGFHMFGTSVALSHYFAGWFWLMAMLAGLGIAALLPPAPSPALPDGQEPARVRRGGSAGVLPRVVRFVRVLGAVVLIALVLVCGVKQSILVISDRPQGLALLPAELTSHGLDGAVLAGGMPPYRVAPYVDNQEIFDPALVNGEGVRAIVLEASDRFAIDARIDRFLRENADLLEPIRMDNVTLYVLPRPLEYNGEELALKAP